MILAVAIMLILLGFQARKGGKSGRPYWVTAGALAALLAGLATLNAVMADATMHVPAGMAPIFAFVNILLTECIGCGWNVPFLLIVWGSTLLRDGRSLRITLAAGLAVVLLLGGLIFPGNRAKKREMSRTDANLRRCGELVKAGKRAELREFFAKHPLDDRRRWNDDFEAAFPPDGGGRK